MQYSVSQRNKIIDKVNGFTKPEKFNIGNSVFYLNRFTLIPHPDTLNLIVIARNLLKKHGEIKTVADVGTGSGIIGITLAKEFPSREFFGSDISQDALKIARKNAKLNKTKNIRFFENTDGVWLREYKKRKVDFIISNPPFVGEKEFASKKFTLLYPETNLEPPSAVVASGDRLGLGPYLEIIKNSKINYTKMYLFQCNNKTIHTLSVKIKLTLNCNTEVIKDALGLERFLLISQRSPL